MSPDTYDVLVLGGGVAGCVLAARLSEDPGRTVCLVEAGPDHGPDPAGWPAPLLDARALPREGMWERKVAVHRFRARVVGGSSCVNGCWNTWGSEADHREWVRAGGERWSSAAMEPYRAAAVDAMGLRAVPDRELSPWARAAVDAARELGHNEADMGRTGAPGYGFPLLNAHDGTRWNAALAYLGADVRARRNLTVLPHAVADRLLVRGDRVDGVVVHADGSPRTLRADRYVVAAGAFGSPALLLRSGVGPADELRALGIAPVADLPGVGANLSDQPGVFIPLAPAAELDAALAAKERDGELYVSRVLLRTASEHAPEDGWDLHVLPSAGPPLFGSLPPGRYEAGVSAFLMKPVSRGSVRLTSADPLAPLALDPGFLTDPEGRDLAVLRSGLETALRLAQAPALKALASLPGDTAPHLLGDDELRARTGTYWHPVGTCAMGPADDPAAVVDGGGRVHGLANLTVADASVLPTVPAANTQLPVLATAELLAAALIAGPGARPEAPATKERPA
ncbi:GMC family oxidoreductase [Streptomyces filamentosus]|uniref:Glucose-methanol-choline oxidoreductase n=1 Tax=Streptomyces filamentosus TaxID=67294 RepID=A0A919BYM6_STRFL|nr:GMC oxidoreductase [Streptomyces filamentosus]GHG26439.1 putative glucose-methanol-choline oxidoreductase [Streptomyces filamentosus]